jgi:Fe-S cluster assembly ATP-binding protein
MKLEIKGLEAEIEGKQILKGIDLQIKTGEVHALMGPNGSGKSTLANVMMGHPDYKVTGGHITLEGEDLSKEGVDLKKETVDLLALETHERARRGVFLAFQYPVEVTGVTVGKFLKRAIEIQKNGDGKMSVTDYIKNLRWAMDFLEMDQNFINRYLNEGFSGGEKKRMEIVQLLLLKPRFAVLDETDSGLDIDALKTVAKGVNHLRGEQFGALIITHYQRILNHVKPDHVHIMYQGRIVASGGNDLVEALEERGYDWVRERYGIEEVLDEQPAGNR